MMETFFVDHLPTIAIALMLGLLLLAGILMSVEEWFGGFCAGFLALTLLVGIVWHRFFDHMDLRAFLLSMHIPFLIAVMLAFAGALVISQSEGGVVIAVFLLAMSVVLVPVWGNLNGFDWGWFDRGAGEAGRSLEQAAPHDRADDGGPVRTEVRQDAPGLYALAGSEPVPETPMQEPRTCAARRLELSWLRTTDTGPEAVELVWSDRQGHERCPVAVSR